MSITLAQQNGGPNVAESLAQVVLTLRKLLLKMETERYTTLRPRFSLILRVDGSLTKFGTEGVEAPKLRKDYVQVDIVVPESRWQAPTRAQREYLANTVEEALLAIMNRADQKGVPTDRNALMQDYSNVRETFLSCELAAIPASEG